MLNEFIAVCRIRMPFLSQPDATIFEIPDPDLLEKIEIRIQDFENCLIRIRYKKRIRYIGFVLISQHIITLLLFIVQIFSYLQLVEWKFVTETRVRCVLTTTSIVDSSILYLFQSSVY